MVQVDKLTHKEKHKMYMKCTKSELAEMLIECNRLLTLGSDYDNKELKTQFFYATSPFCKKDEK